MPKARVPLTSEERATYEWQIWIPELGEAGQEKLKAASVLVSRVGGLGGLVAYELAAAGVGKLVIAHGGSLKPSDLNRQILMEHAGLGTPRIEMVERRLKALNPRLELTCVNENIKASNVERLVSEADLIVDCAPRFEERFLLNQESVRQNKPMVEAAMYDMEASLTTFFPGQTPCLACLHPETPPHWKREFPVFGAVAGTAGCLAATEAIKVITGIGEPLKGRILMMDLRTMQFRSVAVKRRKECKVCGTKSS